MSLLAVEQICKSFAEQRALERISLEVERGQFFTLLGPSGCGKTTLLRVIAGFETADRGTVRYRGRRIDGLPPHRREISMVFQDYAIFPHMNVYQNIAYGLRSENRKGVREKTFSALKTVQLDGLEKRMPDQLSGGQQQRVAVARALATETELILMDEPLSNLDARLRIEMREQIREIQKKSAIAVLYVTHDQEEALAVSDRIAVLNGGQIMQCGAPADIYAHPDNLFTAGFVGEMNLFHDLEPASGNGAAHVARLGAPVRIAAPKTASRVTLAIRPEEIQVIFGNDGSSEAGENTLEGTIENVSFTGARARCFVRVESKRILVDIPGKSAPKMVSSKKILLQLPSDAIQIFDGISGRRMSS